ncbi:MAG: hypothetical protein ACE5H1_08210, partial [Thermodesulfobacteriota bacterium]
VRVGISFKSKFLDIDKISYLKKKSLLQQEKRRDISYFKASNKICSTFKAEVSDLRYICEQLKNAFERYEPLVQSESPENKINLEQAVLEVFVEEYYPIINNLMNKIALLVKDKDKDKDKDKYLDDIYKEYFRHHLLDLFLTAPFINRSYKKPLGYAGDYEMMNMLYQNQYEGKTLFGKFLNGHIWQSPASQAVRNRVPYLVNKMLMILSDSTPKIGASITSIGCGPAKEVQEFILHGIEADNCEFNLIDAERSALRYCQDKVLEAKHSRGVGTKIKILNKSVAEILRNKNNPLSAKQDLIYSVGLFDYLSADLCISLIRIFYENLKPNGTLIIGNFDPSNETRNYMEYAMEWHLIYRNGQDMLDLASSLTDKAECFVEKEATKTNNFLVVKKG